MLKNPGMAVICLLTALAPAPGMGATPLHTVALPSVIPRQGAERWMLHLPGIAGRRWVDDDMARGFADAGFSGVFQVYDWTGDDPGLGALKAYKRNQAEAQKVADLITERFRNNPKLRIVLSGHSGGTGIAVWALEKLPADVKIDDLIFLASALSPEYDLSKALSHVRGKCYGFCSENDILVLSAGTRMFGTIDGRKTDAAGEFGFVYPVTAIPDEYAKLIQKPYDKSWMQFNNVGDHMGCMARLFARHIVAPLVVK